MKSVIKSKTIMQVGSQSHSWKHLLDIKRLLRNGGIGEITQVDFVIPWLPSKKFYSDNKMKRTGIAGIFAAGLELTREGIISVSQKKNFDKLMIKKK